MAIGIRTYGWTGAKVSPWKQMEAWRAARAVATRNLMASNENSAALFAQANANKIDGIARLAMEAATKRINAAAKAKFDEIANTKVPGLDKTI